MAHVSAASQLRFRVDQTTVRMTAPRASTQFGQALGTAARAVMQGLEVSASVLPGGPLVSAAVRGARAGLDSGLSTATTAAGAGSGGAGTPASPADSSAASTDSLLASSADQNMQFLQMQEQLQAENRRYTALSNAMKTRHETAKNAIANLR